MENFSLILVYQQIIYLCYIAICFLIEYCSSLLYHQNGEKANSVSPRLCVLFSFLPLTGATKALCICVALVVKMDIFMDNCIEFGLVSLKLGLQWLFQLSLSWHWGSCANGFINATVLDTVALTGPVEPQCYYLGFSEYWQISFPTFPVAFSLMW